MTTREERIARNEALFREVNERINDVRAVVASAGSADTHEYLCECGDDACTAEIALTPQQYEAIRADARQFVLVPGHAAPDVESVVTTVAGFEVVRKHPEEAEVAERTDPRR